MAKRIIQDIIPPSQSLPHTRVTPKLQAQVPVQAHRSEIPPRREEPVIPLRTRVEADEPRINADYTPPRSRKSRPISPALKQVIFWTFSVVCIVIVACAISLMYASATVTVVPKSELVTIKSTYTAKKNAAAGELQYQVMSLTQQLSQNVPAVVGAKITTRARGAIVFYNSFSTTPQKIPAGTIIANTKNLTYQVDHTVTIPSSQTVKGKTVPGSVTAYITATTAGPQYNASLADLTGDFKVLVYQNTPKYMTIYARQKSTITGGATGVTKSVPDETLVATRKTIDASLLTTLRTAATAQVPEGYILYPNAGVTVYESLPNTDTDANQVAITDKGTLNAILFKKSDLIQYIATTQMQKFAGSPVTIQGLESLQMAITNTSTFDPIKGTPLIFALSGQFKIVGSFAKDQLAAAFAGRSLNDVATIVGKYATIGTVDVILRPFWKKTFPDDTTSITILTKEQ